MTIEEKAYKDSLLRAKAILNGPFGDQCHDAIIQIFPELKESQDEKIRKELMGLIKNAFECGRVYCTKEMHDVFISYLETQKEHQETCTKLLAKILKHSAEGFRNVLKKKGIDYIPHESFWTSTAGTFSKQECNEFYKWKDDMTMELVTEETPEYKAGFKAGVEASIKSVDFEKQKELLFIKDVILGYPGLYFYDGERMHFQGNPVMEEKQKERGPLSKDEEYTLARIIEYLEDNDCPSKWKELLHDVYSLRYQKEQKPDLELIKQSWYTEGYIDGKFKKEPMWNLKTGEGGPRYEKNEKYGQSLEQKPAEWSEEDEKIWKDIFDLCNRFGYDDACRLLKSISRKSWKPSEEQMDTLKTVYEYFSTSTPANVKMSDTLRRLYNDFKKL